jgi:glycosyltransferase involved in cell wall biosynthesis
MPLEEIKKHIKADEDPLVSVITPLYNAAAYISETIKSVQNQTYPHWEHIIVDDASGDDSASIAQGFSTNDPRIRFYPLKQNMGAAYCRNKATKMARGAYIAFLDADDLWHPEKLQLQLGFMAKHQCDVSYTSYLHIDQSGHPLGKRILALPELSYKKQLLNNYVGNLTGMYNAQELGKIEAPPIRKRQDWAVWLEAIKRSGKAAKGLQMDLAFYRVGTHSMSANKRKLIKYNYRFYREYLGYSGFKSTLYLLRFFFEYFFIRPKYIQKL